MCTEAGGSANVHLIIDYHSGVPVTAQIVGQIKYLVVSGRLAAGEQIPSVRALAVYLELQADASDYRDVTERIKRLSR
jgi:hypothetical protein